MKHIALAWTFAAALAAQGQVQGQGTPDPKTELAAVIAVEEQERDLAKAEKLYREALAGTKLSKEARALANLRLGRMLQKLGRDEEAKPLLEAGKGEVVGFDDFGAAPSPQDVEREKALREKARGLAQAILAQQSVNWEPPLHGVGDPRLAEQLVWIGAPAVTEVIAALQETVAQMVKSLEAGAGWNEGSAQISAVVGLAGFLWRTGGTLSAAFLASCAKLEDPRVREMFVRTAFQAEEPAMLAEAARFLNDPDPQDRVVYSLLNHSGRQDGRPLQVRFTPEQIVDAALRGPARGKVRMLTWARQIAFDAATLAKLHGLVREGLKSTDPELGNAAVAFLLSGSSQASIEGFELLLQELPTMRGKNVNLGSMPQAPLRGGSTPRTRFSAEEAARLRPAVDTCARTLAGTGALDRGKQWLQGLMLEVAFALDASVVPQVLAWMDLGYDVWWALAEHITAGNCKDVFARFDRIPENQQTAFLEQFHRLELPSDIFPLLRDKAEELRKAGSLNKPGTFNGRTVPNPLTYFIAAMVKTGDPRAADWIMAQQAFQFWGVHPLIELGRRCHEENVRAAMRRVVNEGSGNQCAPMLLALLALHDEPALDLVVKTHHLQMRDNQPYAKEGTFLGTPLQYLLYENQDPPHGFTEDQVIGVLEKMRSTSEPGRLGGMNPNEFSVDAIPDRVLGVLATFDRNTGYGDSSWCQVAVNRLRKRQGEGAIGAWFDNVLTKWDYLGDVLPHLDEKQIERYRPRLEAMLEDKESGRAQYAAQALLRARPTADLERMLGNQHASVRKEALESAMRHGGVIAEATLLTLLRDKDESIRLLAAQHAGALVSKAAVPDLIALLRDANEFVRTAASDALTRIRFFHEQQAHWDRVLKGLDASPASAAEKLLLQAKPTAPRAQRLLAITSLGTLGAPEALPFLIEWTSDADAEVAAAAKAAITQIHLNPRR